MVISFVEVREAVKLAFSSIVESKFRSFLTILGVMVGVSSVICLASVINGLDGAAENEIASLGTNVINVSKFPEDTNREDLTDEDRNRPPITAGEARAILQFCPSVSHVAPQNYYFQPGGNEAKFMGRKFSRPNLMGTWPDYVKVRDRILTEGRFISKVEEQFRSSVCVIGADVADVLFEGKSAEGKEIRVNGNLFQVIGVFERQKSNFGNDFENRLIAIPLSTFEKLHPWEEELGLMVRAESYDKIDQAQEEIISALRQYRKVPFDKGNNFALSTQDQFREQVGNITGYIYIAMVIITSVGLMVGGIGVMNIMLVSVTERTREIGVRKAIGAKRANIILQFLTEAMTLSGTGGVIGVVAGVLFGLLINLLIGFPPAISVFWIVLGFVVAVSVGMISGIYPAIKAAWLDPIDALRYE